MIRTKLIKMSTSKKNWMVRAGEKGYLVDEFIENGIVAIGWDEIGIVNTEKGYESLKKSLKESYPDFSDGKINQSTSQIWKFVSDFKLNDRVVTYDSTSRVYYLGTIESDYEFDGNREYFKHIRKVKWDKKPVFRDNLSPDTRNTLGSILTLFELNHDVWSEFQNPINKYKEVEPGESGIEFGKSFFRNLLSEFVSKSNEFIKDVVLELEWNQVEDLVAGLLRGMGYRTQMTSKGRDLGSDILASPDGLGMTDPRIKVEVKHRRNSKNKVGANDIRNFVGGMRGYHNGIYVSTTGFAQEAKYESERANVPITMIDIDRLVELITEYYEQLDPETRALLPLKKVYWPM